MNKIILRKVSGGGGKENKRLSLRRVKVGERVLFKDKLIIRDIFNEMMNGVY